MKKTFTLLCVILSSLATMANGVEVDSIYYLLDSTNYTASVTYASSSPFDNTYSGDIVIPDSIYYADQLYFVTTIGDYAFHYCSGLISVTIPNSITTIGEDAFSICRGLTLITIPNSVTTIEEGAFRYCSGLTSVTIPNSVTTIGDWAFGYCTGLVDVDILNGVTSIGKNAFYFCSKLTSISIPNSTISIGMSSFGMCTNIESVSIGSSVNNIGVHAFNSCSYLKSIVVAEGNPIYDSRNNCNAIIETETNTLVVGCKRTIVPNTVSYIGDDAFSDTYGLTYITLPNSIIGIGEQAFYDCQTLASINIPNSVISIGDGAFSMCMELASITCRAVEPPSLGSYVFGNVPRNIPLYVPAKSVSAYQVAEQWNEFDIQPLLVDVDPITPDTTKLIWLPMDSASLYQLHIYAEQIDFDTTLYIEADSLNGGIRIPVTTAPKRISLDDISSVIIIIIEPRSGITKETPFVVTVSTTSTDRIDVGFDLKVLCGSKIIKSEEGSFTFNPPVADGIDDVLISNWSSAPSIYDLYGHRYSTNQWSSVPAGIYILRAGNKAIKVMKQ